MSTNEFFLGFSGPEFYASIIINSTIALVTIICIYFVLRSYRSSWYLVTNGIAFALNLLAVIEVISRRQGNVLVVKILISINIVLTQFLILLLIHQNTTVLDCFSFLNVRACKRALKFSEWFLKVEAIVTLALCVAILFALNSFVQPDERGKIIETVYSINSVLVGVFLILQTAMQNFWITWNIYTVGLDDKDRTSKKIFQKIILILGSCVLVDL